MKNKPLDLREMVIISAALVLLVGGVVFATTSIGDSKRSASPPSTLGFIDEPRSSFCGDDAKTIYRLHQIYFLEKPELEDLTKWENLYKTSGLETVSLEMADSETFSANWNKVSIEEFVQELLYEQLLEREPDSSELEYWVRQTENFGKLAIPLQWAQQPEIQAKHPVASPEDC